MKVGQKVRSNLSGRYSKVEWYKGVISCVHDGYICIERKDKIHGSGCFGRWMISTEREDLAVGLVIMEISELEDKARRSKVSLDDTIIDFHLLKEVRV